VTLEQATARLDEIAQRLGRSDLELSESLALYEEGVRLLRHCDGLMNVAEERIRQIRADGEGFRLDPVEERK
jgi:exodeoxyribonuclease VII small subunit